MSNPAPRTPKRKQRNRANHGLYGATPTRAGVNFVSSTNLGHTQQEIKSSLWGRILTNEPGIVERLIKPHLVDNGLVDAIERAIDEDTELRAARDLLFENVVLENQMYTPMVTLLRHISTFHTQSRGDASSLNNVPTQTPNVEPTLSVSTTPSLPSDAPEPSACALSPTASEQWPTSSDDPEQLSFLDDGENHGLCIKRTWVNTHSSLLRTDRGLYISVRGTKDADEPDGKRPRDGDVQTARSKVARTGRQVDAAMASHTASEQDDIHDHIFDSVTTPEEDVPNDGDPEGETPEEARMDDRKPDISLIDLPHSDVVPAEYLWRQCAVFMEMKKNAWDGPLRNDLRNARLPEGAPTVTPTVTSRAQTCKAIITQMADNARILMATRPFLRFCLHIAYCGTNFNLALFDRNGAIISRTYNFETHLRLFIRIIRRLSCGMTAYDLGLDTTVRPEGCLGSVQYPPYLVKVSDGTWYRTEGVPLWQSTSLLGRGTLVFNARDHSEPNEPIQILKNAWREDGRPKESELYEMMQDSERPFESPKALAKFVVGGDVPLHDGRMVTIEAHRARFNSKVVGNGATVHRLVLASRGKNLASYVRLKQLLKAAWAVITAHKRLYEQGILHGDISYGNIFLLESREKHIYGFLADLDLASINDEALNKFPEETAKLLKEQRRKGPRSGTVIFMAIELLQSQVRQLKDEQMARKSGKPAPPAINTPREVHHDLEALIWVLVYSMMIHNYNSLTHEADREQCRQTLDEFFGHGSARTTLIKRHALMSFARSHTSSDHVAEWFSDPYEQRFFIRCMKFIAEHSKAEEEEVCWRFQGGVRDDNPPWDSADDESDCTHEVEVGDSFGTYMQGKDTNPVQKPAGKRQPILTYESVVAVLKKSIDELT